MNDVAKLVGFMPWLQLKETVRVAGFAFVPYTVSGIVPNCLEGLKRVFPTILSSHVNANKQPQTNCVVVVDETANSLKENWNITETRIQAAYNAASLLFLAAWSKNEYFTPIGSYVNSNDFSLYFQRFAEPADFIAFHQRRRDGPVLNAGLRQGSICFTNPIGFHNIFQFDIQRAEYELWNIHWIMIFDNKIKQI